MKNKLYNFLLLSLVALYTGVSNADTGDRREFTWEVVNASENPIMGRFATWSSGEKSKLGIQDEWLQPGQAVVAPDPATLYGGAVDHWCIEVSNSQDLKGHIYVNTDDTCNVSYEDRYTHVTIRINGDMRRDLSATILKGHTSSCEVTLKRVGADQNRSVHC